MGASSDSPSALWIAGAMIYSWREEYGLNIIARGKEAFGAGCIFVDKS
ncbi:predicted protein [Sclerotinia sclerotiorum 1980 UF-70]|uniref:Uncharacterized protein n=1 Tax=Sclerotinia sclerotiorum (strain ATCC 18683 / 1980 / Ss-1) TaxID=665079 RepID=A7EHG1_SCLS1|nr:predicted protein [Sclerotinia sclerotiorum 1980 UF-70]EDO02277.1 predicted protein [Sclerotinia sclerotiorum 1980 UF-70]